MGCACGSKRNIEYLAKKGSKVLGRFETLTAAQTAVRQAGGGQVRPVRKEAKT